MRKLILLITVNLVGLLSFSQANDSNVVIAGEKTSYVILKLGVGLPQSDFGDDDPNNFDAGLAKRGILLEAEFRRYISDAFFVSIVGKYQTNNVDAQVLADDIASQIPINFTAEVSTTAYQTFGLMTGFGIKAKLDSKTNFFTRLLVGYSSNTSPAIDSRVYETQNPSNEATVKQAKGSSDALAYSVGLGFDTELDKKTKLLFDVEYFGANASYDEVEIVSNNSMGTSRSLTSFDSEIRLVNISIGIAIKI